MREVPDGKLLYGYIVKIAQLRKVQYSNSFFIRPLRT